MDTLGYHRHQYLQGLMLDPCFQALVPYPWSSTQRPDPGPGPDLVPGDAQWSYHKALRLALSYFPANGSPDLPLAKILLPVAALAFQQ